MYCKTKGNARAAGKQKVYFTAHPDDTARYLDPICCDLWQAADLAVCHSEDPHATSLTESEQLDLEGVCLLVVPVTLRLLTEPNRAMEVDIPFAKACGIPVLPFMMESGLDALYARPDRFGSLQYLCPNENDLTAIDYGEKLKNYLNTLLPGSETLVRVRKNFAAYLFLSYRKCDRRYANALLGAIHSEKSLQGVAVWYDEFLTPGESFSCEIEEKIRQSELFLMALTPMTGAMRMDESGNMADNFIVQHEYPLAKRYKKTILPVEMTPIQDDSLAKFTDLPPSYSPQDLPAQLERYLCHATRQMTPTERYLLGLAYLDGIDVEVNRALAVEMIEAAAKDGCGEAMHRLGEMYAYGIGVQLDYRTACRYSKCYADTLAAEKGKDAPETLAAFHEYCMLLLECGEYHPACRGFTDLHRRYLTVLGQDAKETLTALDNLATCYGKLSEYQKAVELGRQVLELTVKRYGEENRDVFACLNNLVVWYLGLEDTNTAIVCAKRAYELGKTILGSEHTHTVTALCNLAYCYGAMGDHAKAISLYEQAYAMRRSALGEEHPDTLQLRNNLAYSHGEAGHTETAVKLHRQIYEARVRVLGEKHPDTLKSLSNTAFYMGMAGEREEALALHEKSYRLCLKTLGEDHFDTLNCLLNVAYTHNDLGQYASAAPLFAKVHAMCRSMYGAAHHRTKQVLSTLADCYGNMGEKRREMECREALCHMALDELAENYPRDAAELAAKLANLCLETENCADIAVRLFERILQIYRKACGEKDQNTLQAKNALAFAHTKAENYKKALAMYEDVYRDCAATFGEEHIHTFRTLYTMAYCHRALENYQTAAEYYQKLYFLMRKGVCRDPGDLLSILYNFALCLEKGGNKEAAHSAYRTTYDTAMHIFGKENDFTKQLTADLARTKQ